MVSGSRVFGLSMSRALGPCFWGLGVLAVSDTDRALFGGFFRWRIARWGYIGGLVFDQHRCLKLGDCGGKHHNRSELYLRRADYSDCSASDLAYHLRGWYCMVQEESTRIRVLRRVDRGEDNLLVVSGEQGNMHPRSSL